MNALQFQVAILEAQQRARLAVGSFMEDMQGVQNAATPTQTQPVPNTGNGQRPDSSGTNNLPQGNLY
jgi:hypothetical protein